MKVAKATSDGVLLRVKVIPKARKQQVRGVDAGFLKVAVSAPAEKGRANRAAIGLLAGFLGVARTNILILSGETSREKQVKVLGRSLAEIEARLAGRQA